MPKMRGPGRGMAGSQPAPDVDDEEDGPTEASLTDWAEMLGHEDPAQREVAVGSVAILISRSSGNAELALSNGIHATLVRLLAEDPSLAVRADAAGGLRNLASCGVAGAPRALLDAGVVAAVAKALPMATGLLVKGGGGEGETAAAALLAEQAAHVLSAVCETSAAAVTEVNRSVIPAMVLACYGAMGLSTSTVMAMGSCLQIMSEDNPTVDQLIRRSPKALDAINARLEYTGGTDGENASIRTAAAAIGFNAHVATVAADPRSARSSMVAALVEAAGYDSRSDLPNAALQLPRAGKDSKVGGEARAQLSGFDSLLSAQQSALEVLANLCVGGGHESGGGGGGAAAATEAELEAEWKATMAALVDGGAPAAALSHCAPVDAAVVQVLAGYANIGRTVLDRYCSVQARALVFIQNLLTHGGIDVAEDVAFLSSVWEGSGGICAGLPPGSTTTELVDAATGSAWAVLRGCIEAGALDSLNLDPHQALAFCELAAQLPVGVPAATNVAGILGCLGQSPSVAPALPEIAESLVRFLGVGLEGLGEDGGDAWLVAEALNSVFDVFAEPETNAASRGAGLLAALESAAPRLEACLSRGRLDSDSAEKIAEAGENLMRFLEYKAEQ